MIEILSEVFMPLSVLCAAKNPDVISFVRDYNMYVLLTFETFEPSVVVCALWNKSD